MRRYRIEKVLGRGGQGTVYQGRLETAGGFSKPVAIKVLDPEVARRPGMIARLRDEARMLGLLHHRAIVQVDGLFEIQGRHAVVMELVEGCTLLELLRQGPLPLGPALLAAAEIAGALDVAWQRPGPDGQPLRLLHRDVKPGNVQVSTSGDVKLLDFGVARAEFDEREARTQRVLLGTPNYMAPERYRLLDNHEGDVFALGMTLVATLRGEEPRPTPPEPEAYRVHLEGLLEGLDERVVEVLRPALAYEAERRPAARIFERSLLALQQQVGGDWLHDWAETSVPAAMARRTHLEGELSGATLVEQEEAHTFLVDLDAPEPEAPAAGSPTGRVALFSFLGLALACSGLVGLGALGLVLAGRSQPFQDEVAVQVDASLGELASVLDGHPEEAQTERLVQVLEAALADERRRRISLIEMARLQAEADSMRRDGYVSEVEAQAFEKMLLDSLRN
jgi:hypothetical protein